MPLDRMLLNQVMNNKRLATYLGETIHSEMRLIQQIVL